MKRAFAWLAVFGVLIAVTALVVRMLGVHEVFGATRGAGRYI